MKRLAKILALFLLVVILVGFYRSTQNSVAAGPSGAGVNIDPTFSPARPTVAQLLEAGVRNVRMVYKSDTYDYLTYISSLKRAGIDVVMILNQETLWPPSGDGNFSPQYVHDFSEKAKLLATKFGNNVKAYEIWNEEDATSVASIEVPANNYASLLASTYNAIKSVDKSRIVLVGGLVSGKPGYLDQVKAAAGGTIPADGIAVHPYIIDTDALVTSVKSYFRFGLPVWITEFGWETNAVDKNGSSVQASYLCAVYTKMQSDPQLNSNVAVVQWYNWTDAANPGFGLVDASGTPKASFQAFQKCASQFSSSLSQADLIKLFQQAIAVITPTVNSTPNASNPGVSQPPPFDPTSDNDTSPPTFHPLGSLEQCPPEIPINGKIVDPNTVVIPQGGSCGITPLPEPAPCKDPSLIGKPGQISREDWCAGGDAQIRFCNPESQEVFVKKGGYDCGGGADKLAAYARSIKAYCLADPDIVGTGGEVSDQWKRIYNGIVNGTCSGTDNISPVDIKKFQRCLQYFTERGDLVKKNPIQILSGLPTCVPTTNKDAPNRCVSECSPPINVEENLKLSGSCLGGDCKARITIDQNKFFLPFAAELGNYFLGILDSEHLSNDQLDKLQQDLRNGTNTEQALGSAGVFKKLMPGEVQDKLKCDFVTYVADKKKSGGNTKYLDRSDPNNIKEFKIFDKNITDIKCPPTSNSVAYEDWQNKMGKYWFAVPLFNNDEALGKIDFVSPSVFSNNTDSPTLKDANGNPVKVGPVYVSLPEIQRLDAVTSFLQKSLLPEAQVNVADNPETIGEAFTPTTPQSNSCIAGWTQIYDSKAATDTLGKNNGLSVYDRAVNCNIPTLPGQKDSDVCTIDPNGQLRCGTVTTNAPSPSNYQTGNYTETVQVRTVFPHLYDIAEQTISPLRGLLRIFKPTVVKNLIDTGSAANLNRADDMFEKKFEPIPASINDVHYKIESENNTLKIQDKPSGWQIFFYKLGGLEVARNFVLELLSPKNEPVGTGSTPVQTPHQ